MRSRAAYNLTAWGFQDCQYEAEDGSYGGMVTKLLFRFLPQYYPRRSSYAHFPFLTPKAMEPYMTKADPKQAAKYIWTRPKPLAETQSIVEYNSVYRVLSDSSLYLSSYEGQKFTVVQRALGNLGVCPVSYGSAYRPCVNLYVCRREAFPSATELNMTGISRQKKLWLPPLKMPRPN